ncbi:LacI family DNA-binding transcriptional regulator [Curtobacterium sp. MCBD17_019]|uniref:LacI family DNA-binding transcriptional regulator n=1 Tax=Curtobacterium sp. MCBD17_019 TaxID=2175669 RepID=UPI000DA7EB44|nr:LacI family DNA-binding transcriptional regulator [Curtobacterium sp. MCBD17_019]PZE73894.1 LacI family transcriptional regulator [Curtobacterium sp. MCBD17_019]
MATTIYDVASRAGVSPATVSRVFNGSNVSPDKVRRVRRAAEDLQFTPNRTARTLRRRNSEVIALVIPDIENPYFTEMARGVADVVNDAGYSVVLCNTDESVEREAEFLRIAESENMAGIIVAPASAMSDLGGVVARGRPVVAVDRPSRDDVDVVTMFNREAGREATEHLIGEGYRRIACITGPADVSTAVERAGGWSDAVARATGHAPEDGLLWHSDFRVDGGVSAMEALLALPEPPDAVVAANNLMGVGVLQVLDEHGLSPLRFGVAVVGALPFTTISPRAVTIVRLPAGHMGATAARLVLERIAGDTQPSRTIVLRHTVEPAGPRLQGP